MRSMRMFMFFHAFCLKKNVTFLHENIKKRPHGKFKVGGHSFLIVRDFIEKKDPSFGGAFLQGDI